MFTNRMSVRLALAGMLSLMAAVAVTHVARADDTTAKPAATKSASASGTTSPIVVVVDIERIQRETLAGKALAAEADKYGKEMEDQNRAEDAVLHTAQEELQKQHDTLPQDQFNQKARAFEQRLDEARRGAARRRQAFDKSQNIAIQKFNQVMLDATRDVATSHNADLVVRSQALIFFNTSWDVTPEIIEAVNKRLTKVDFPPPKVEPEAPGTSSAGQNSATAAPKDAKEKKPKVQLQLSPQQ